MLKDLKQLMKKQKIDVLLMYGKGENVFYLTKFVTADPIHVIFTPKKTILLVSSFEVSRAEKESIGIPYSMSEFDFDKAYKKFRKKMSKDEAAYAADAQMIFNVLKKEKLDKKRIGVLRSYSAELFDKFKRKIKIKKIDNIISLAREIKDKNEIKELKKVQTLNEKLLKIAIDIIKKSKIKNGLLKYKGKTLTVGFIKQQVKSKAELWNLEFPENIIVSCGKNTSDPHYFGKTRDKILPNQPILLDFYPKNIETGFWGDSTRSIVKGKPSKEIVKMHNTVLQAQEKAFKLLKPGIFAKKINDKVSEVIEKTGYKTLRQNSKIKKGFTHSTGHGVGLFIHEAPFISDLSDEKLKEGQVFSIEPGIYDPKYGGVRIEDLVLITKKGFTNLNKLSKTLEI